MTDERRWNVVYDHKDGRCGIVEVMTEIQKVDEPHYGNGKYGRITVGGYDRVYDLRYEHGDLHDLMLKDYFGKGLVEVVELLELKAE